MDTLDIWKNVIFFPQCLWQTGLQNGGREFLLIRVYRKLSCINFTCVALDALSQLAVLQLIAHISQITVMHPTRFSRLHKAEPNLIRNCNWPARCFTQVSERLSSRYLQSLTCSGLRLGRSQMNLLRPMHKSRPVCRVLAPLL